MPQIPCPRCGKKVKYRRLADVPTFPFCSERCRLIDLGNWLDERYRISEPVEKHQAEGSGDSDAKPRDDESPEEP